VSTASSEQRRKRLAEALKENLKRRKQRQRGTANGVQPPEAEAEPAGKRPCPKPAPKAE
jgi:hypothetical protein